MSIRNGLNPYVARFFILPDDFGNIIEMKERHSRYLNMLRFGVENTTFIQGNIKEMKGKHRKSLTMLWFGLENTTFLHTFLDFHDI